MYIAVLGRQPALGIAELERVYGDVSWFSEETALVRSDTFNINRLGGTLKAGRIIDTYSNVDWRGVSENIVRHYLKVWQDHTGKITLGISAYGLDVDSREVQKLGLIIKSKLKQRGVSIRLIPQDSPALSTATNHHNKLGLTANKVEILIARNSAGSVTIAESVGSQNITAYSRRDQNRPKRDAFVGMLPPKLAQIIVNLAAGQLQGDGNNIAILDPFCGTGVILQEALLMGYSVYGTDISEKMIDYSEANLEWLAKNQRDFPNGVTHKLRVGNATDFRWNDAQNISAVATETYLGQPFSAPPAPAKLEEVRNTCNRIIKNFLVNISVQISPGTPLCLAVPAWLGSEGEFTHLPITQNLQDIGYKQINLRTVRPNDLLYFREGQVVARELLLIKKT